MKILILGVTGMLGSSLYKYFSYISEIKVTGVLRDINKKYLLKIILIQT